MTISLLSNLEATNSYTRVRQRLEESIGPGHLDNRQRRSEGSVSAVFAIIIETYVTLPAHLRMFSRI